MVTLLRKYNGENIYNNRVTVDYERQKVTFMPVKDKDTARKLATRFLVFAGVSSFYISLIPCLIFSVINQYLIKKPFNEHYSSLLMILFVFSTTAIFTLLMGIKTKNKKWMRDMYPKMNDLFYYICTWGRNNKKQVILPVNLTGNMAIIPNFGNVSLSYKLYEDFADIKKVIVNNNFNHNAYEWYAIFFFNKKVVNGKMIVRYQ